MKKFVTSAYEWGKSVIKIFLKGNCAMHAAGLPYSSMLSIVPIVCIILIGAKMVGADEFARTKIHEQFELFVSGLEKESVPAIIPSAVVPKESEQETSIAKMARDLEGDIFSALDKIDFETIGFIGFLLLIWTAMSSIGMIEISFNEIWEAPRQRAVWKRILMNFAVILVLPLLSGLALGVPVLKIAKDVISATIGAADVTKWLSNGTIWVLDSYVTRAIITLSFSTLAFAFLYMILPTCRIRWRYAVWCGFFTAIVFGGWMKVCAIAQVGLSRSSMLYGSLAFFPIILTWMYISWQIILLGCCAVRATHICMFAQARS